MLKKRTEWERCRYFFFLFYELDLSYQGMSTYFQCPWQRWIKNKNRRFKFSVTSHCLASSHNFNIPKAIYVSCLTLIFTNLTLLFKILIILSMILFFLQLGNCFYNSFHYFLIFYHFFYLTNVFSSLSFFIIIFSFILFFNYFLLLPYFYICLCLFLTFHFFYLFWPCFFMDTRLQ